jgi:hypothetical protein
MLFLHDVHNGLIVSVRLSVRMFQLENRWTDFDEIWYGRSSIRGHTTHFFLILYIW